jgi:CheY-like chemotaxis protein
MEHGFEHCHLNETASREKQMLPSNSANDCRTAAPSASEVILIVEDNEKNARLMIAMLKAAGYQTAWAADGNEGLRMVSEVNPRVIITDLQMPNLDGLAMTRELKSRPETAQIPVLAVSAHALAEHRQQALAAGCCKFLTKPFRYESLLAEVADVITCRAE